MANGRNSLGPRGFLTEDEKKNMPKVTKGLLLRIFSYLKPYWVQFLFVFVAILLSATVGLFPSIITGKIVDQALVGEDMALLIRLLLMAFCTIAISQVIGVLENYINSWISQQIIYDMKNQMYRHLQYMPHSFFTSEKQGDIITRMNTDISGVSTVISGTLSSIVSNLATVITTLVALFTMNWKLAAVGIVIIPLLILPSRSAGKKRYELLTESQEKNDEMNQVINETLSVSGSMLVKIFTREEKEYENFEKINKEVTSISLKERRSGKVFTVVMGMFGQIGPLLIYFVGGLLIIGKHDPTLTVGTITATVTLINRLYRPVESLLNIGVDFTRSLALFTRIFDYFDKKSTIVSPKHGQKPNVNCAKIRFNGNNTKWVMAADDTGFTSKVDTTGVTDIEFLAGLKRIEVTFTGDATQEKIFDICAAGTVSIPSCSFSGPMTRTRVFGGNLICSLIRRSFVLLFMCKHLLKIKKSVVGQKSVPAHLQTCSRRGPETDRVFALLTRLAPGKIHGVQVRTSFCFFVLCHYITFFFICQVFCTKKLGKFRHFF